jgi:hypothetical protein
MLSAPQAPDQIALQEIAAEPDQAVALLDRLDAFADHQRESSDESTKTRTLRGVCRRVGKYACNAKRSSGQSGNRSTRPWSP